MTRTLNDVEVTSASTLLTREDDVIGSRKGLKILCDYITCGFESHSSHFICWSNMNKLSESIFLRLFGKTTEFAEVEKEDSLEDDLDLDTSKSSEDELSEEDDDALDKKSDDES
jgi:hypothetical protein